jgi:LPXTG-motif cell wall-anchored protein
MIIYSLLGIGLILILCFLYYLKTKKKKKNNLEGDKPPDDIYPLY